MLLLLAAHLLLHSCGIAALLGTRMCSGVGSKITEELNKTIDANYVLGADARTAAAKKFDPDSANPAAAMEYLAVQSLEKQGGTEAMRALLEHGLPLEEDR